MASKPASRETAVAAWGRLSWWRVCPRRGRWLRRQTHGCSLGEQAGVEGDSHGDRSMASRISAHLPAGGISIAEDPRLPGATFHPQGSTDIADEDAAATAIGNDTPAEASPKKGRRCNGYLFGNGAAICDYVFM
uniref:Uncharacterized protein n=1 Tax=Oryza punctata TaxID=4537 RepID=A0A0E0LKA9_ORYPU